MYEVAVVVVTYPYPEAHESHLVAPFTLQLDPARQLAPQAEQEKSFIAAFLNPNPASHLSQLLKPLIAHNAAQLLEHVFPQVEDTALKVYPLMHPVDIHVAAVRQL